MNARRTTIPERWERDAVAWRSLVSFTTVGRVVFAVSLTYAVCLAFAVVWTLEFPSAAAAVGGAPLRLLSGCRLVLVLLPIGAYFGFSERAAEGVVCCSAVAGLLGLAVQLRMMFSSFVALPGTYSVVAQTAKLGSLCLSALLIGCVAVGFLEFARLSSGRKGGCPQPVVRFVAAAYCIAILALIVLVFT